MNAPLVMASPQAVSFLVSLLLHAALLVAPALVGWFGVQTVSSVPRGDGAIALEWVELAEAPALPAPPPKITKKAAAPKAPTAPAESVPVLKESKELASSPAEPSAAAGPAPQEMSLSGSSAQKALTLGSRDGLSTESLKYHDELYLLFESRKTYPLAARRLNQQGEVLISLRIWANGKIDDQRVIKASPYQRLNEAALAMVRQVKQFKPLPQESGPYAYFHLPIEYSLN